MHVCAASEYMSVCVCVCMCGVCVCMCGVCVCVCVCVCVEGGKQNGHTSPVTVYNKSDLPRGGGVKYRHYLHCRIQLLGFEPW